MEAMNVVDEDLTELTDSELVAVGRALPPFARGHRRARAPRAADRRSDVERSWPRRPSGELYDLRVVHQAVRRRARAPTAARSPAPRRRHRVGSACASTAACAASSCPTAQPPRPGAARAGSARRSSTRPPRAAASASSCSPICEGLEGDLAAVAARGAARAQARPSPDLRAARGAPRRRRRRAGRSRRRRRDLRLARAPPRARRRRRSCAPGSACASSPSRRTNAALLARPHAWRRRRARRMSDAASSSRVRAVRRRKRNRARDAARPRSRRTARRRPVEVVDLPVAYAAIPRRRGRADRARPGARPRRRVGRGAHAPRRAPRRQRRPRAHRRQRRRAARSTTELVPGGEPARQVPFDPRTAANAAIAAGCPCEVSSHAGTFCCNAAPLSRARSGGDSSRHVRASPSSTCRRASRGRAIDASARGLYAIAQAAALYLDVTERPYPIGSGRRRTNVNGHDDYRGVHQLRRLRAGVPQRGDLRG